MPHFALTFSGSRKLPGGSMSVWNEKFREGQRQSGERTYNSPGKGIREWAFPRLPLETLNRGAGFRASS